MRQFSLFILFLILAPFSFVSAQSLNAGFVQGLWYSEEPVFADKEVRIYVALRNNAESDLTGTVRFTDNDTHIGTQDVSALAGRLIEAWVDWNPSYGEHILEAHITNAVLHSVGGDPEPVTLTYALARDELIIDYDTDEDGIGNSEDTDDDDDGMTDEEETENGTDPLVYDEPETEGSEDGDAEDNGADDDASESDTDTESGGGSASASETQGLEQYFDDGTVKNTLTNITSGVNTAKNAVDTYRAKRAADTQNTDLETTSGSAVEKTGGGNQDSGSGSSGTTSSEADPAGTGGNAKADDLATITRSTVPIKGESFVSKAAKMFGTAVGAIYTFILWILSMYLSHPAFVQFTLLLLVLWLIYHFARKVTRRPIKSSE